MGLSAIEQAMHQRGFHITGTGGNCTAYSTGFRDDGTETLLTVWDDAMVPQDLEDRVHVGIYGTEHSEPLEPPVECTLRSFLSAGRTDR